MKNIFTIAKFELKRLFRDWRLVLMVLSQPIVIALIVGLMVNSEPKEVKILVFEQQSNKYSQEMIGKLAEDNKVIVNVAGDYSVTTMEEAGARAIIKINFSLESTSSIEVLSDPTGAVASMVAEQAIIKAVNEVSTLLAQDKLAESISESNADLKSKLPSTIATTLPAIEINGQVVDPPKYQSQSASPKKLKYFDYFSSSMMIVLVLLVILNLSGISITSERVNGTFERLSVTPFTKSDIVAGKALVLFLVGLLVNALGIFSLKLIYGAVLGNLALLFLVTLLSVGVAVSLGLLISAVTKTVVESVELAMYVFFVAFLSSGIISVPETGHKYFVLGEKMLPFYHAVDASRRINMLGAGWQQISTDVYYIAGYFILFMVLSVVMLRREAK